MEMPVHTGTMKSIEISNCKTLIIRPKTFAHLNGLNEIQIRNVNSLDMGEYGFSLAPTTDTKISFDNVAIKSLPSYAFAGPLRELSFQGVTIEDLQPYSVSSMTGRLNKLSFLNSTLGNVQGHAFKKFICDDFSVEQSSFDTVTSKAFYQVEVTNLWNFQSSNFTTLHPAAFGGRTRVFRFEHNQIFKADAESFNLTAKVVQITQNNFTYLHSDAFISSQASQFLTVWENNQEAKFSFMDNSVEDTDAMWQLRIEEGFLLKFSGFHIVKPKSCDFVENLGSNGNDFYKSMANEIWLKSSASPSQELTLQAFMSGECKKNSYIVYGVAGIVVLSLILIAIIISVLIYFHRQKQKLIEAHMVSPEPRTYRETQIIVQIENHNLLKTDFWPFF